MKKFIVLCISIILMHPLMSQELLEIESGISISSSNDDTPKAGTIRWSGADFEGWNGVIWVSLSGQKSSGTVTDIDGNVYRTIRIGNQEWMVENLRTSRFRDGTDIEHVTTNGRWNFDGNSYYCWYNNDSNNESTYGKLYNWYAVESAAGLCPADWHVPYKGTVDETVDFLGNFYAGGKMKTTGTQHWASPNSGATNLSGFSGLPGGRRQSNGDFHDITDWGYWWTQQIDLGGTFNPFSFSIHHSGTFVSTNLTTDKRSGFSVRCFRPTPNE